MERIEPKAGNGPAVAAMPRIIGLGAAGIVALVVPMGLPLVPFLVAGYLATQASVEVPALRAPRG